LESGGTVALLLDRPAPERAAKVTLFGQEFQASMAAAELARASGCAIVPTIIVREGKGYLASAMPEIEYDRASLRRPEAGVELTGRILHALEPAIRRYLDQWYHFTPVWPKTAL
jgi:lauroyl/myristoyl acyltransferase